jgi:hypothetical protein
MQGMDVITKHKQEVLNVVTKSKRGVNVTTKAQADVMTKCKWRWKCYNKAQAGGFGHCNTHACFNAWAAN